jgi:hypothetical protein
MLALEGLLQDGVTGLIAATRQAPTIAGAVANRAKDGAKVLSLDVFARPVRHCVAAASRHGGVAS